MAAQFTIMVSPLTQANHKQAFSFRYRQDPLPDSHLRFFSEVSWLLDPPSTNIGLGFVVVGVQGLLEGTWQAQGEDLSLEGE